MAKWQAVIEKLWVIGAIIIDTTDDILDESAEILRIGGERLLDLAGQADYVLPGPGGAVTVELRNSRTRLTAAAEDGVLTVRAVTRARAGILEADGSGPLDDRALERLGK